MVGNNGYEGEFGAFHGLPRPQFWDIQVYAHKKR